MESIELASLSEFVDEIANNQKCNETILYRGQEDSDWPLVPSFYRQNFSKNGGCGSYETLIRSFRKELESNAINPSIYFTGEASDCELESLAQHYGLPTKLFDWTYSAYIALFFAYGGANRNFFESKKKVSVYVLFYDRYEQELNNLYEDGRGLEEIYKLMKEQKNYVRKHDNKSSIEKRIRSQKGTFLYMDTESGNLDDYFHKNCTNTKSIIRKYTLPSAIQKNVLNELYSMGLDPARLMGDMEGVCQSVYNKIMRFCEPGTCK